MMRLEDLVRPNIQRLVPYSSARHEFTGTADVFLDANESPYPSELNRYPDPYQARLKSRIAELKGLSEDQIFLGNGSDEAIDLMIRIFCEPRRDEIMILPPTYGMYKVAADIADVWVTEVPLIDDFQLDVDMIPRAASGGTKLLFICSPNNPTGNLMSERDVRKVLREFLGVVVIDEAYADFVGHSWTSRLDEFENLIVMQTLSKAWGLAGIRLGMAFAHPKIIRLFNAVKPPYNVNVLTQTAALEGLSKWEEMEARKREILAERDRVQTALHDCEVVKHVYDSAANFLLVKFDQPKAIYDQLTGRGIVVRDRSNLPGCGGCLRITIGTPEENNALLDTLSNLA